ncbi:SusF/SusE family outer membrane protein [Hallella colorans]|uniref:SusF/SusE family outer membrane protein n=1 Tax=Hallella colorans TaxID=1703337 RepID=UPI0028898D45|nr:SusF/SusE family outer membrane protein [Hallella colorans]
MKLKNILFIAAGFMAMTSCSDDITTPVLKLQQAAKLNAVNPADITFTQANSAEAFPKISWEKANYGKGAVVEYTVTITNNENKKSVVAGITEDTKLTFTNDGMNSLLAKVGAYPGHTYDFTVSLKSSAFKTMTNDAQNTVNFKATPYDPNTVSINWKYAYVAVGYPEWDYSKAYLLGDPDGDGTYQGWVQFDEECTFAVVDGKDITKVLAKDQKVDAKHKGFVEITLTPEGNVTIGQPCEWGMIGEATSGGWTKDTKMEYDKDTRMWTAITPLTNKEFKFRANEGWDINYGSDPTNPEVLSKGGNNLKVAKTHAYIVKLDLTTAGKYTYTMEETDIEMSSAELSVPGSYQGWNPTAKDAYRLESKSRDFQYTGIYYYPANTEFKLYDDGKWLGSVDEVKWNDTKTKAEFALGDGANIKLTEGGWYRITANTKKMLASIAKTGWEIIGDATPGGWDKGQLMTYNPKTKKWSITIKMKDGEYKFRWDASWEKNFGGALTGLTQGGGNIKIGAGTYLIELDPEAKTATVTEK